MTRAEYLEYVQEGLVFPETGLGSPDPTRILYDHEEVIKRLRRAHADYCKQVAAILEIDLPDFDEESGGPEDKAYYGFAPAATVESEGGHAD